MGATSGTLVRANNTIGYFLPAMGGLYGQVDGGAGRRRPPGNDYFGGRIGYAAGPFNVAFAYGKTTEAKAASSPGGALDLEAWNIGGSWNFGFMTLMGQYHEYDMSSRSIKNYLIGATIPLGAGTIKAELGRERPRRWHRRRQRQGFAARRRLRLRPVQAHRPVRPLLDGRQRQGPALHRRRRRQDQWRGWLRSQGMEFGVRHSF